MVAATNHAPVKMIHYNNMFIVGVCVVCVFVFVCVSLVSCKSVSLIIVSRRSPRRRGLKQALT